MTNVLNNHIGETVVCKYSIETATFSISGELKMVTESSVLIGNVSIPLHGKKLTIDKISSMDGTTYYGEVPNNKVRPLSNIKKSLLKKVK